MKGRRGPHTRRTTRPFKTDTWLLLASTTHPARRRLAPHALAPEPRAVLPSAWGQRAQGGCFCAARQNRTLPCGAKWSNLHCSPARHWSLRYPSGPRSRLLVKGAHSSGQTEPIVQAGDEVAHAHHPVRPPKPCPLPSPARLLCQDVVPIPNAAKKFGVSTLTCYVPCADAQVRHRLVPRPGKLGSASCLLCSYLGAGQQGPAVVSNIQCQLPPHRLQVLLHAFFYAQSNLICAWAQKFSRFSLFPQVVLDAGAAQWSPSPSPAGAVADALVEIQKGYPHAATKFCPSNPNTYNYVFHCHILEHEVGGGQGCGCEYEWAGLGAWW